MNRKYRLQEIMHKHKGSTVLRLYDVIIMLQYASGVSCVNQGQCVTRVSFEATRSTSLSAPSVPGIVSFNNMTVDHWSFNKQNNSFTAPVSGYYWLHVSIAIPDGTMADVQLQAGNTAFNIIRSFTTYTGGADTTSTGNVVYLTQGTSVSVNTTYPLYSDNLLQTAFGGFLLDSVMSPVVAFSLFLPSFPNPNGNLMSFSGFLYSPTMMPSMAFCGAYSGYALNVIDPVFYDSVIVNKFFTPQSGIYYVHIVGMTRPYNSSVLDILVNGQPRFKSFFQSVTHNNNYKYSRGSLLRLQMHDEMHVRMTNGQVTSSFNRHMTFSGFLIHLV
jgi:hypothetical protein